MPISNPSVLAFERKIDPSDAFFYAGNWEKKDQHESWAPVSVTEKSVRGTISNRMKKGAAIDPAKIDASIEKPNLQTVDVAALPMTADTLKVRFTLRVLSGVGTPSACNNIEYQAKLTEIVSDYVSKTGFRELAERYAANLANGRFLWRNRIGAEEVTVRVEQMKSGKAIQAWDFDSLKHSLISLSSANDKDDVGVLASVIESGLNGDSHTLLQVTAFVRMGNGQEVFPSQELILDKGKTDKSRTLYVVAGVAGIHSQKIGNALRTIDTWYPGADSKGPIAVEPYGSVTSQGRAYRQPKDKSDFYSLLDGWMLKDNAPELGDQHFVIATLIRGGVFGESGK